MMRLSLMLFGLALACAAPARGETLALTGATVHTMGPAGTVEDATVVVTDGRIVAVGRDVAVPGGAEHIDAGGKVITPGIVSAFGQLGLVEVGAVVESVDYVQRGERFSAAFDVADAYNPRSTLIAVNRSEGVTTALVAPRAAPPDPLGHSSHVLSGLAALVSLGDGPFLERRAAALVANLGEAGSAVAANSRAAAILVLRTALDDALDYRRNKAAYDRGERRDYSVSRPDLEALLLVLDGRIPLLAHVDRASDISVLLELAAGYAMRVAIVGGAEAWMIAEDIAAAGVPVILDGMTNLPTGFDRLNARLDAASILLRAGVDVSFGGSSANQTHNARNLTQAAGIAVANGLPWDAALRAITLVPAEVYGVADRIGSIEPGKQADFVIWPADPLELTTYPDAVYIRGVATSMSSRQTLL
ncbi:MAG: amidohydrolase family protein, partial [Woeseiaceae bacterium]